jgi:translation initiation factor IF-2
MRVYELARELSIESEEILARCKQLGLRPKNRLSGLKGDDEAALRKVFGPRSEAPVSATPTPIKQEPPSPARKPANASGKHAAKAPDKHAPEKHAPDKHAAEIEAAKKAKAPPAKPAAEEDESEEGQAAAQRRRKKGRTTTPVPVEEEEITPRGPVLGRFIPPSTIQRYPRRPSRRSRPKFRRSPSAVEKPAVEGLQAPLSVKDLSAQLGIKANQILGRLMQRGVMVNINAMLGAEEVRTLAKELGFDLVVRETETMEESVTAIETAPDRAEDLQPRPPVVTFLGHVDHGKTSLLDCIRKTDVAAHEHGGITQHIGAYRVTIAGKTVVFLDTPGHEAFTAMRARGANVTDIAVLVVAADDGVMPQTEEAIDHARAANVPIVVAINKCDKPEANPTRVRQDLTRFGLQAEEWGGDTVCVDVSAVTGKGVDELVEMLSLVAELRELKANPDKPAHGTVLEAQMSETRGPLATVLIQEGSLRVGDIMVAGATFGRVKALYDDRGRPTKDAGPSCPVAVAGLNALPEAGDRLLVLDDLQKARSIAEERGAKAREAAVSRRDHVSLENLFASIEAGHVQELLVILKCDVRGTLEAVTKVLSGVSAHGVKVRILRASVGGISTSDVLLADASDAIIVGMNVAPDPVARSLAEQEGVSIRTYTVIYRLKEEIEKALVGMLAPEEREVVMGHAEVRQIFRISRFGVIAGCFVRDGVIARNHRVRLLRDNTVVHQGRIGSLRRVKDDVREAREGFECGIHLDSYDDIKVGDVIESYQIEKIAPTLESGASATSGG